ncbi:hypothetical protein [Zoogloea sp.]|uniref:hypothetical protein n=1 Tax=Zoogloea sp. TaxID=49181 RepID=UPI002BD77D38|nr:hypothetical protein [Zoogloea sp.]HNB63986.1 hypothetical protein [Rhodocyclaceae bacterium]HNH16506.1 hypothetical protein [Zoogloea sp.]
MSTEALAARLAAWAAVTPLTPSDVDCTTTVMLKILDGKCKMSPTDKVQMAALYDLLKDRPGARFGADFHALIARAREGLDEALRMEVYEQRLLAETRLSRPVMKAYKAMLRATGALEAATTDAED